MSMEAQKKAMEAGTARDENMELASVIGGTKDERHLPFNMSSEDYDRATAHENRISDKLMDETGTIIEKMWIPLMDAIPLTNCEMRNFDCTTNFNLGLHSFQKNCSGKLVPIHLNYNVVENQEGSKWVPEVGEIVSTRTPSIGRQPKREIMTILEDVILGRHAGTETSGEKLVCVQVEPDPANTKWISTQVGLTSFGTHINTDEGASHHLEIHLQLRKNTGWDEFYDVPYVWIWVEYKRRTPEGQEGILDANCEEEYWQKAVQIMPRMVRQTYPDFWVTENKSCILEAHIPRIKELPNHELELLTLLQELPIQWYLDSRLMEEAMREPARSKVISVMSVTNGSLSSRRGSKRCKASAANPSDGKDQTKRRKLGRPIGMGRATATKGGGHLIAVAQWTSKEQVRVDSDMCSSLD